MEIQLVEGPQESLWVPVIVTSHATQSYSAPTNPAFSTTGTTTRFTWSAAAIHPAGATYYNLYGLSNAGEIELLAQTGVNATYCDISPVPTNLRSVYVTQDSPRYGYVGESNVIPFAAATPSLTVTGVNTLTADAGLDMGMMTVAQISGSTTGILTSEISWGDGTRTFGSISSNSTNVWTVSGDHVYSVAGAHTVTVYVHDSDGNFTTTTSSVEVQAWAVPYIQGPETAQQGQPYVLKLFTNGMSFPTWSINWGDGTEVQTVPAGTTSIPHTFTVAPTEPIIIAQAINSYGSVIATSSLGLDPTYGTNGRQTTINDSDAIAIGVQSNGDVVTLTSVGLERFDPGGQLDSTFGGDGVDLLQHDVNWTTLAIGTNDDIALGGAEHEHLVIALFKPDGSSLIGADSSGYFNDGNGTVQATAVAYAHNEVAVVGNDVNANAASKYSAVSAKFSANGNGNWQSEVSSSVPVSYQSVAIDPGDGYVNATRNNGSVDQFDNSGNATEGLIQFGSAGQHVAIQSSGEILLGGQYLELYSADGTPDPYFGSAGTVQPTFQILQLDPLSNGRTLALGRDVAGNYLVARYDVSGRLDATFGVGGIQEGTIRQQHH